MITIRKQREPKSLTQFRASGGKKFDDLDSVTKNELRASLLKEQGYICAYCMKRIGRDRNEDGYCDDVTIEHVVPRAYTKTIPEMEMMEIDYSNLVAVCTGNSNGMRHCDKSKENNLISFNPCNPAVEASIKYGLKDGTISSSNESWDDDLNSQSKLNLNHPTLKTNRKAALKGLIRVLDKKKWSRTQLERRIDQLDNNQPKAEYVGILKYFLNKKLSSLR